MKNKTSIQTTKNRIPFCKPDYGETEKKAVTESINSGFLEGGGEMSQHCESLLQTYVSCIEALIVPSCTAALEMMALALDLEPGDEIIMPSFTFVSTANAFAIRGAVPVFVDIDEDTLNIDPTCAEAAITEKTKAIMLVHYAGVACDMPKFQKICEQHHLILLEDAAQCVHSYWDDQALGSFGKFGAFSFHHTKNISCGEGGALLVNDSAETKKVKMIRDKGTNRHDFLNGVVSKYEWQTLGSSYLLSELSAAALYAQLMRVEELTSSRLSIWNNYYEETKYLAGLRCPVIPSKARHNGHIFHLRLSSLKLRNQFVDFMRKKGIIVTPHYVPLHLTPGGRKYGKTYGDLDTTVNVCNTLVRLPLYSSMTEEEQSFILDHLNTFLSTNTVQHISKLSDVKVY